MDTLRITTFTFGAAISPPVLLAVRTCRRKFLKDWETLERHSDSKRIFVGKQPPPLYRFGRVTGNFEYWTPMSDRGGRWLKVKNPNYTQAVGRRAIFDKFRERT